MGHKRRQFITTTGEVDQEESKKQMNPDLPSSTQSESQPAGKLSRFDLSAQILTGLIVGVGCVGLLRMTVLPYISVTLIASLGRLTWTECRRLAWIGGLVLLTLWAAALITVAVMPIVFPAWKSGSFFSTTILEKLAQHDMLSYFIPHNIFEALSDNDVPAIVLFVSSSGSH